MTGFKISTMLQRYLKKMERQEKKDEIITGRSGAAGLWLKVQSSNALRAFKVRTTPTPPYEGGEFRAA